MTTPTPGAASELLPWQEGTAGRCNIVTYNGEDIVGVAYVAENESRAYIIRKYNEALSRIDNRTPAPVTEGAQREAVADEGDGPDRPCDFDCHEGRCPICMCEQVPPPPDRVQPERVEAVKCQHEPLHGFCVHCGIEFVRGRAVDVGATSEWPECSGDPASCPENEGYGCCKAAPPTDEPERVEAHCGDVCKLAKPTGICCAEDECDIASGARTAPPNDASGGVTDELVERACSAIACEGENVAWNVLRGSRDLLTEDVLTNNADGVKQGTAAWCWSRAVIRAALEAADRARKPVPVLDAEDLQHLKTIAQGIEDGGWHIAALHLTAIRQKLEAGAEPERKPGYRQLIYADLHKCLQECQDKNELGDVVDHVWTWLQRIGAVIPEASREKGEKG